jgi:hypothetical protein
MKAGNKFEMDDDYVAIIVIAIAVLVSLTIQSVFGK